MRPCILRLFLLCALSALPLISYALPPGRLDASPATRDRPLPPNVTLAAAPGKCVGIREWLGDDLYIKEDDCRTVVSRFYYKIHHQEDYLYEFIAPGIRPSTYLPTFVKTPWKFSYGTLLPIDTVLRIIRRAAAEYSCHLQGPALWPSL